MEKVNIIPTELEQDRQLSKHEQDVIDFTNLVKKNFSISRFTFSIWDDVPMGVYEEVANNLSSKTNYVLSFEIRHASSWREYSRVICYMTKKNTEVLEF